MSWKKMIFGEKMPDKDDPKYKERYEREVAAVLGERSQSKDWLLFLLYTLAV